MRRAALLAAALLTAAAPADAPHRLLERGIAAAGGRAALMRVHTLAWSGTARIFAGGRTIDIGMSTKVTPFAAARSDSWLLSDGPGKPRSLIIEDGQGFIERDGKREPMPAAMLAHERAQYALYGLMLLAPVDSVGAAAGDCLTAKHMGAPDTVLCFNAQGRLAEARNEVPDPEGGAAPIAQRFTFEGMIESNGVHWPRVLKIEQGGKPYFELTLTSFIAG